MPATINAFWIGPELGNVHAACLRSFLRHGHRVVLHAYEPPRDMPDGVEHFDAARLMQPSEIRRHKTGSLALASDIYRYRILAEGMGLYVDCDVFCLKPFPESEYLFGWESNDLIGSAVLGAPADSEMVRRCLAATRDPHFIPSWLSHRRQRMYRWRKRVGLPKPVTSMPWGAIGPGLVTQVVRDLGLMDAVMPVDAFYPVNYHASSLLCEPGLTIADISTSRSYAVHLYNFDAAARDEHGWRNSGPVAEILAS